MDGTGDDDELSPRIPPPGRTSDGDSGNGLSDEPTRWRRAGTVRKILVDRLGDHIAGEGVDIALVPGNEELEEPGQRRGLALPGPARQAALLPQIGQEPVGVGMA